MVGEMLFLRRLRVARKDGSMGRGEKSAEVVVEAEEGVVIPC